MQPTAAARSCDFARVRSATAPRSKRLANATGGILAALRSRRIVLAFTKSTWGTVNATHAPSHLNRNLPVSLLD
jgi:hypothetical protein